MRIIAGEFRGYNLESVKSDKTRPTLERVREALFSKLFQYIPEAKVLDLFAGTGMMGLEAISRGASYAVLNDKAQDAITTIFKNVKQTKTEQKVSISKKEYDKCIKSLYEKGEKFDIIFLDPPYLTNLGVKSIENISKYDILTDEGIIVFETDIKVEFPKGLENLEVFDEKRYGRVYVSLWRRKG
ncbi:MAG: 16S rRNA (guanine(966)-N(2))-methyltransferase RsmD [Clostridia bacterium]